MKKTPERIEKLAAEFVLGSLQGLARARFERWMMESYRVRQEVWFWEAHLGELNQAADVAEPSQRNWERISQRLWPDPANKVQAMSPRTPSRFWRPLSLIATAASLVLAVALTYNLSDQRSSEFALMATISSADQTQWIFNTGDRPGQLLTRAVAATPAGPDKDYELWVLPRAGNPVSLGTIQADGKRIVIDLTDEQREQLLDSRQLAISLEPKGGSPIGAPTGPVLHVTELLSL